MKLFTNPIHQYATNQLHAIVMKSTAQYNPVASAPPQTSNSPLNIERDPQRPRNTRRPSIGSSGSRSAAITTCTCRRDAGRYEAGHGQHSASSTQERRKLLKRTRSLAVISEDECRAAASRDAAPFDTSSLQHRRHQLIPWAKLIDRNSLKDR